MGQSPRQQGAANIAWVEQGLCDLRRESPVWATGYDELRLADAVFWLSHGDGGRPLLRRPVLEVALAGGLLAELGLAWKLGLWDGTGSGVRDRVCIRCRAAPEGVGPEYDYDAEVPADELSRYVYDQILADPRQDLGMWLVALRTVSLVKVRARLGLAPLPPSMLRRHQTVLPRAPTGQDADRAWAALTLRIRWLQPLSDADGVLIGLGLVTGLRRRLLEGALPPAHRHAESAVTVLPRVLAQVVAQTEAAIARSAVKPRP